MRIVVDLQGAQSSGSRNRGIGRYVEALALSICRNRGNHDVHIILSNAFLETIDPIRALFQSHIPSCNIHIFDVLTPNDGLIGSHIELRKTNEAMLEAFIGKLSPDVILVASLFEGFIDNSVTSVKVFNNTPTVVVLYDLIPLINPNMYLQDPKTESWYFNKIDHLKRADLLLSISASSGKEAVDYLGFSPEDVVNISTACDPQFKPIKLSIKDKQILAQQYSINRPFIMYTGGIDHRKNIEGLIRAFAGLPVEVRNKHQLIIVCSVHEIDRNRLTQLALESGLKTNDFIMTGFVPEDDLVKLYNGCKLFVFPSWHEGFGLPALEAMQCGRPVIASNTSSLPEVIGNSESLFDPKSDQSITEKMLKVLTNNDFRNELVKHSLNQAKKFNWDDIAISTINALVLVATTKTSSKDILAKSRPRLAYLSPLPPERSGISGYSVELLEELTKWYSIDVITNQVEVNSSWIKANCGIRTVEWFEQNNNQFDRVIYHFGNSDFHKHMFDLLRKIPGVVVLHDFFLSGVQSYIDATGFAPNIWKQSLYKSHGYQAVALSENEKYPNQALWTYPTNLSVLQNSLGIIVHSENSISLAQAWYKYDTTQNWYVIPLLRSSPTVNDKAKAREALGLEQKAHIICSFGIIGETKQSYKIIEAFINSNHSGNKNCYLIFVGQKDANEYGLKIDELINKSNCAERILITGWTDNDTFKQYLQAADVGVQLRTLSRGETSATVLDCMNYGITTIVNANGSMADLSKDCVYMLPDEFSKYELTQALEYIYSNKQFSNTLSLNAKQKIQTDHLPRKCAVLYNKAIEDIYENNKKELFGLSQKIKDSSLFFKTDNHGHLKKLGTNFPTKNGIKQIFIDVSYLIVTDGKTGIQRVVKSILQELLNNPPAGYRIEPVYAVLGESGYSYARKFTCNFLKISDLNWVIDEEIDYQKGDIFLGLDLHPIIALQQKNYLTNLRNTGVKIAYVIYDLLPILQSQYFMQDASQIYFKWLNSIHFSDQLICISEAVADETYNWLKAFGEKRSLPLSINWFHLGADIENSMPTQGIPLNSSKTLELLKVRPTFLMVGTLEPRKAYDQVLKAFNALWQRNIDINLVLVGKRGWLINDFINKVEAHQNYGKRLFWLDAISDQFLSEVYNASSCLIAASYGEGFGLPLIEASQHNLPIIARDIKVFREVAGDHAMYFDDTQKYFVISDCVEKWLKLSESEKHVKSSDLPWITWRESTKQLIDVLVLSKPAYKIWHGNEGQYFWGNDPRFLNQIGKRIGKKIQTDGKAGFLIYGPYQPLKAGDYTLKIIGDFSNLTGDEYVEFICQQGTSQIFSLFLSECLDQSNQELIVNFSIKYNVDDFELRLYVCSDSILTLNEIFLSKTVIENEK